MKTLKILMLSCLIFINTTTTVYANEQPAGTQIVDIILYRPVGAIATLIGGVFFVVASPFTALANIAPPHDAFERTGEFLFYKPAKYTFERPLGVYWADADGEYRRR